MKQYAHNHIEALSLNKCFITNVETEMESKMSLENYGKKVNQHLYEHNYFSIGTFNGFIQKQISVKFVIV